VQEFIFFVASPDSYREEPFDKLRTSEKNIKFLHLSDRQLSSLASEKGIRFTGDQ